jgi:formate hydrogenlyase subunit 6/NADH:ubiquinone oxidoreductase subunit I
MLNIFKHALRRGIVTTSYPSVEEPAPEPFRGQVLLDSGRCAGDGACARACPSNAIAVEQSEDGWVWTLDDARCVFCGLCQEVCPEQAIVISNEFELATRASDDLVTTVTFVRGERGADQ